LTVHPIISLLKAKFKVLYLDDASIGGDMETLSADLTTFGEEAGKLGLCLNLQKSELIRLPEVDNLPSSFRDMKLVQPKDAVLLGSPIGDVSSIDTVIKEKIDSFTTMGERLAYLARHDALLLLRHAFALPKVLYILRSAPCFLSKFLEVFDGQLCSILSSVLNVDLSHDSSWLQASLPVRAGGLGIRQTTELAPTAFLASAAGCHDLVHSLIPSFTSPAALDLALQLWSKDHGQPPPPINDRSHQKAWDAPRVAHWQKYLLSSASDNRSHARLLAASTRESGYWLDAPPISSLGLRMEDNVVRIAAGLRLGVPLVLPHDCAHCGSTVDDLGTHGLSCRRSKGRHSRHASVNNIIQRALSSAGIPSHLETKGISIIYDGKPDGITLVPWKCGRSMAWDFTCVDTFAASHLPLACVDAGAIAADAENRKMVKYQDLASLNHFCPAAVETAGPFGPNALNLFKEIGRQIKLTSGDSLSTYHLFQHVSVAVQRGNAASVLGTIPKQLNNASPLLH
jgi:hypothetical protein